jgi:hypothetical protein
MAKIIKYVNSGQPGNDGHTGDDPVQQPWLTIQHGVDWWHDNRTSGDTFDLRLVGEFNENVRMVGPGYSDITIETWTLGFYNPKIIQQYCEARVPCGGYIATGTPIPGIVFDIQFADHVTLRNLTILLAEQGVYAYEAHYLTLDNCCIHDNSDNTEDGAGFRINNSRNVTVNQCYVWSNRGQNGGGGYLGGCVAATIEDTFFYQNNALHKGGALAVSACQNVEIAGCSIGAPLAPLALFPIVGPNHADRGGGVWVYDSTQVAFKKGGLGPLWTLTVIDSNSADKNGGGIWIERDNLICDVTLEEQTEVKNNQALDSGGGIGIESSNYSLALAKLTLDTASLNDNQADQDGGGIWARWAVCSIQDSSVSANQARVGGGGIDADFTNLNVKGGRIDTNKSLFGGGLSLEHGSKLSVENTQIADNIAEESGGGIYNQHGDTRLTGVKLTANESWAEDGEGGGICASGRVTLNDCTFTDNKAFYRGGGAGIYDSELTIDRCTFTTNSAVQAGPPVTTMPGRGGALSLSSTKGEIVSSTFTQNTAVENGGAIEIDESDLTKFTVSGNSFSGNSAPNGKDILSEKCPNANANTLSASNKFTGPAGIKVVP